MTVVYAVESWILAIFGWGWLSVQEAFAWSLLSAFAFYGMLILSTLNLIMVAVSPKGVGMRSGYFAAVLSLTFYCASCTFDTFFAPSMGAVAFESPFVNETGVSCSFAQTQQLFFFGASPFYVVQAAALLGYLIVQLLVAGAGMMDAGLDTLWPGSFWYLCLCMLLCCRFVSIFDGTPKAVTSGPSRYIQLFSRPLVELASVFAFLLNFLGSLLGVEGLPFDGLEWRKGLRYVTFVATMIFFISVASILSVKGVLTPSVLALLFLILGVGIASLVEAVMAQPPPPEPPAPPVFMPGAPPLPQPVAFGRQAVPPGRSRFYIPSAVEMSRSKNKGV